jgi:hypothetical protein
MSNLNIKELEAVNLVQTRKMKAPYTPLAKKEWVPEWEQDWQAPESRLQLLQTLPEGMQQMPSCWSSNYRCPRPTAPEWSLYRWKHASRCIWPGPIHQASFKLERDLNNAPNLACLAQTSEMHSYFINLINHAIDEINKVSTHFLALSLFESKFTKSHFCQGLVWHWSWHLMPEWKSFFAPFLHHLNYPRVSRCQVTVMEPVGRLYTLPGSMTLRFWLGRMHVIKTCIISW